MEHPRPTSMVNFVVFCATVLVVFLLAYNITDNFGLTFGEPRVVTVESFYNDYSRLLFGDDDICTIQLTLNGDELYDHRSEEFCERIKPGDKLVAVSALTRLNKKRVWKLETKDPR